MVRIGLILVLIILTGCGKNAVTVFTLLSDMSSRETVTYYPKNDYRLLQASSYNRKSVSPNSTGWFENNDMSHFIRVEQNCGRREFVMLDTDGPGAVVRWWMTFYKAQNGRIRIYIDNYERPVVEGSPDSLVSGSLLAEYPFSSSVQAGAPIGEYGRDYDHNLYFPIPFSKHCKITYECDSIRILYDYEGIKVPEGYLWPDVFYNIDYRIYENDVNVKSFSLADIENCRYQAERSGKLLLSDVKLSGRKVTCMKELFPGDSVVLRDNTGMSAVSYLQTKIISRNPNQSLRSVVISASFDGSNTIWVPVGDFFGSGYTEQSHRTFFNSRDSSGVMRSYWMMPYRRDFSISFINYGNDTVKIMAEAQMVPYKWNYRSMYFGACWHEHYNMRTRDNFGSPFDMTFVKLKGKGVYCGDQITLFNNTYQWWGEGDEKIFVDGEAFPSSFGTGTEDYYGYSFARQEPFSHPFISQPVGTGNMTWGVTLNMRHRVLDAIPFSKSIDARIEMWHWADIRMNYALTSYYYLFDTVGTDSLHDISLVRKRVAVTRSDFEKYKE